MITNSVLIKKLKFKGANMKMIVELVESDKFLNDEGSLKKEELLELIKIITLN